MLANRRIREVLLGLNRVAEALLTGTPHPVHAVLADFTLREGPHGFWLLRGSGSAPLLVRYMLFNRAAWERQRQRGWRRWRRRMTQVGFSALGIVLLSFVLRLVGIGAPLSDLLSDGTMILLMLGLLAPFALRSIAGFEWRLLEARYAWELAREAQSPRPTPQ